MSCIRKRAPAATSPSVRKVMQQNVGRTTGIEARLQTALKGAGLHFEVDRQVEPDLRWKADLVFVRERLCVFVDGCFWHGCPIHFKAPHANTAWWTEKIQANVDRDRRQDKMLKARQWTVLRLWEHDLNANFDGCVETVLSIVHAR